MTDRDKIIKKSGLEGIPINERISKSHPYGDEIAILRKALVNLYKVTKKAMPKELEDYNAEVERIKADAREDCGLD